MKVRITHMKAPWPEGAKIGDVLEVSGVAPWARGKCVQVGDDETVTLEFPEPVVVVEEAKAPTDLEALVAAVSKLQALVSSYGELAEAFSAAQQESEAAIAALKEEGRQSAAQIAELREQLAALVKTPSDVGVNPATGDGVGKPAGPENVAITGREVPSKGKGK
jgi:hypothetical protein